MKALVAIKRVMDHKVRARVNTQHTDMDLNNVKMAMNPFCEIAVEQAVRLKEAGQLSEVVVASLGPEAAQEQLRQALAMGADRALHVRTDERTDALTNARLLQALYDREQPDLVLLGKQAIDSDNNQTGQMLAALTNRPQGTFASALELTPGQARVTREIDGGLQTLELTLPAIVTTDLRLNEPRFVKLPDIMKAKRKPLEKLSPEELDIRTESALERLAVEPPPERQAGILVDSVSELVNHLRQQGLLTDDRATPDAPGAGTQDPANASATAGPGHPDASSGTGSALVIAELQGNQLAASTARVLTAATQLAARVDILVAGQDTSAAAAQAASLQGVTRVLTATDPALAHQLAEPMQQVVLSLADNSYDTLLAAGSTFGKNLLPRVAARLGLPQVSDVTEVVTADTFKHPIYAGNAIETVRVTSPLKVLTLRTTQFESAGTGQPAPVESCAVTVDARGSAFVSEELSAGDRPELGSARVVISGGRGLGSAENFGLLERLADKLNGAIGASRAAVDAGFVPNDLQVGQTGKIVAPELYIAVGLSGAIQHLAGMQDSKVIVAINKDPDAPIFQVADYGLVGDLFEILPELEQAL